MPYYEIEIADQRYMLYHDSTMSERVFRSEIQRISDKVVVDFIVNMEGFDFVDLQRFTEYLLTILDKYRYSVVRPHSSIIILKNPIIGYEGSDPDEDQMALSLLGETALKMIKNLNKSKRNSHDKEAHIDAKEILNKYNKLKKEQDEKDKSRE